MSAALQTTPRHRPAGSTTDDVPELRIGDVVFIRIPAYAFRQVAAATGSWTNHVGIVVGVQAGQPTVGESRFPFSGTTSLARFAARSEGARMAVARLRVPLSAAQQARVVQSARARDGVFYDTGFDLHSRRQFCSRYVHEVLHEAAGTAVGEVQSFRELLAARPDVELGFWRAWYFGSIPWKRQTVTPASLLASPRLQLIFDGVMAPPAHVPTARQGATSC
jgi:hypothetical protein